MNKSGEGAVKINPEKILFLDLFLESKKPIVAFFQPIFCGLFSLLFKN